jgi:hypothetical protein
MQTSTDAVLRPQRLSTLSTCTAMRLGVRDWPSRSHGPKWSGPYGAPIWPRSANSG